MTEATLFRQSPEKEAEIDRLTQEGIEKGLDHAKAEWRRAALLCVLDTARNLRTFTMNDVRERISSFPEAHTHDNRAWGGVIKAAQKLGWVKPSGSAIRSKVGHGTPLQVWESLV